MSRLRADALLLLTALIWGVAFVVQKTGNTSMGALSFVGWRFFLSAILIMPFAWHETRRLGTRLSVRELGPMGLIGLCLFGGAALQQLGLKSTSATNGGFLTALYIVLVPLAGWLIMRTRLKPVVVLACLLSLRGAWLLAAHGTAHRWVTGDFLVLAGDIFWSLQIVLISYYSRRIARPLLLAVAQYGVTAFCSLTLGFMYESQSMDGFTKALPSLLYAGLLSGGVAFTLQIIAQRHTPATEAALIMSLESVFAALAGALWLHESLPPLAMAGCALILIGVGAVETGPYWRSRKAFAVPSMMGGVSHNFVSEEEIEG